jgi:hypothetical protein
MNTDIEFDVALSFAGENREFVERVARHLQAASLRVLYDDDQRVEMWGKNLQEYLDEVYRQRSLCVVMFISQHYATKSWPTHERQSAMARAMEEKPVAHSLLWDHSKPNRTHIPYNLSLNSFSIT